MSDPANTAQMLKAAIELRDAGCTVVPTRRDGGKAPHGRWKEFQTTPPTPEQIGQWFAVDGHTGIGVITGAASGGLEMVELEGRAVEAGMLQEVERLAEACNLGRLYDDITQGWCEMSPSGGIHWFLRCTGEPIPGNTKLANAPDGLCLAETRGEGGFVVVAPSNGNVHESGKAWERYNGGPATVCNVSPQERQAFLHLFTMLDTPRKQFLEPARERVERNSDELRPGDDFNERMSWHDILTPLGWTHSHTHAGVSYWTRPGKRVESGTSATSGRNDADRLYNFSSSVPGIEPDTSYSKFEFYTAIHHNGDWSAAARDLAGQGYGKTATPTNSFSPIPSFTPDLTPIASDSEEGPKRSSWFPRPINTATGEEEPPPAFLQRSDGHFLLYRGKVNGLLGESESGKTWVALHAVAQTLQAAQRVIYLDFEDTARGILSRLTALGVTPDQLTNITYASPDEHLNEQAALDIYDALAEQAPDLVVLDGVNAAMTMLGLDLEKNKDATTFSRNVLRPLKSSGACVLTIDHVPKNRDNRGNYAIGAQAKRADLDGVGIAVEVVSPFGRGQSGELRLTVTKDRPGFVRAISQQSKFIGSAHLASIGDGVKIRIAAPSLDGRPTALMEKASRLLEEADKPLAQDALIRDMECRDKIGRTALQVLCSEGFAELQHGPRKANIYVSLKPYRQVNDADSGQSLGTFGGENAA